MTERKDTKLATRRREIKAVAGVQDATPVTFVQLPIAQVLASAQRIVATELAFMAKDQGESARLDTQDAKKLQSLMSALQTSSNMEKELSESELSDLSDEELEAELLAELESIRARKAKLLK